MALTELELAEKAKAGTLTIGEAIDFGEANAKKLHPNVKSYGPSMSTLRGHLKLLDISPDTLYKDMQGEASKFTVEGSPAFDSKGKELRPASRITPLQHLESILRKGEQTPFEKYGVIGAIDPVTKAKMYPQLVGAKTAAGGQRTGLAQTRQMRGVLPKADFVRMYDSAIPNIVKSHGQAVADIMTYHATTFNRPSQLLGLKKSDAFISGDEITVRGKKAIDNKGRPELTFKLDSPMGQLLKRNFDSTSEFLFDVTEAEMDEAFARHISPQLEKYSDILPVIEDKKRDSTGKVIRTETPVLTKSAVRHIAPTYLIDELGVDERLVEVMMGHKQASTLRKHYAGMRPNFDLPKILESPENFARLGFTQDPKTVNLDLLNDADKKKIAEEQKLTLISEQQRDRATADADTAKAEAEKVRANLSVTPEEIAKSAQIDQAKIEADELAKIETQRIQKATRDKVKLQVQEDAKINSVDDLSDKLKSKLSKFGIELGSKTLKSLPFIGAAYTAPESYRVVKEATESITGPGILPTIAGSAAAASEFVSPLAASDIQEVKQATPNILSAEQGRIDELRQRGRDRAGMNAGDGVAPPDDNFLTMQP
jgi:integrase